MAEFALPLQGFSSGFPVDKQQTMTSGHINNCRPIDVLEKRLRIGQRPGFEKLYAQQIAGVAGPIVAVCSVTVAS